MSVLISSAGRRVALLEAFRASVRDLGVGDARVLAADASEYSAAFHRADQGFVVPRCADESYIPTLLSLCEREGVRLVVPTIDPELPILAAHRHAFAAIGATVAVSGPDTVAIGSDKWMTHRWLREQGFPTVRQSDPGEALARPADWAPPLLVKPVRGSASIGVEVVGTRAELEVLAARGDDLIVQSIAPGAEHTVDVYVAADGAVHGVVPRRRLETRGGEVSKGITVRSEPLIGLVTDLVARLPDAFGALNVQVFLDEADTSAVIEINARFGGGFPLTHAAGADYTRWLVEEVYGLPGSAGSDGWRTGVVMLRWDDAVFLDVRDLETVP